MAIVNQTFARRYLRGMDPLSACIGGGGPGDDEPCARIVGVVADAHYGDVTRDAEPFMYRPIAQRSAHMPPLTMMYVRTTGDPTALAGTLRRELQSLDARVSFATVRPMTLMIEPQLAPWRIGTFIFSLFGVVAGLVAGAIVAALSTRLFASLMFGVSALDPVVYIGTAVLLAFIALAASYLPARRATRVDPIEALRTE
ncbi:MAG: hypothetical protein JF610_16245 [Acidobacteria bacterium]|nr:hypothetical protein [Acidobacteriota bacterium]